MPAYARQFPNSLVRINPANGDIESDFPIGSDPGRLARSADGQFLYVALDGEAAIRRFDLISQTLGPQFRFGTNSVPRQFTVSDLEVFPNDPNVVVAAIRDSRVEDAVTTVTVFDHGTRRPLTAPRGFRIEVTPDGQTIYGQQSLSRTPNTVFDWMTVGPEGVKLLASTPIVFQGGEFRLAGGLVYSGSGEIVDPVTMKRIGLFPLAGGEVWPELASRRVLFLSRFLRAYDFETRREIGKVGPFADVSGSLVRCGPDRLAFRTIARQIVVLRTSLLPTGPETNLRLEMSATPDPGVSGSDVEMEIIVHNLGTNVAERLHVELPLPESLAFRSAESSQFKVSEYFGQVTATLSRLEPGASAEAKVRVRPSPEFGLLTGAVFVQARLWSAAVETNMVDNFAYLPLRFGWTGARNSTARIILPNNDMVYDSSRRLLYASVPSAAGFTIGDTIAFIDPATALAVAFVPVGHEPGALALSSDRRFLYFALNDEMLLRRLNLATRTVDNGFRLSTGQIVAILQASPRDADVLALAQEYNASQLNNDFVVKGTNLFALDFIPPDVVQPFETRSLAFSEKGDLLYVFWRNPSPPERRLSGRTFSINENPPVRVATNDDLKTNFDGWVFAAGGWLYAGAGQVLRPDTLSVERSFFAGSHEGEVIPDPGAGRVYYLRNGPILTAFDLVSKNQVYSNLLSGVALSTGFRRFMRWGADGFAFQLPGEIYVLRNDVVPIQPASDNDGDGIPDAWERAHDLNPNLASDALEDFDGDGARNLLEFLAGTDPRDPQSVFRIAAFGLRAGKPVIQIQSVVGQSYWLQTTDNFADGRWQDMGDEISGTGNLIEIGLPAPINVQQFFRMRVKR